MKRLVFATGGSGGHIYPALAVAEPLRRRGFEVHLLGGAGGMEEEISAQEGVPFIGVPTGKLDRQRPDPRALWRAGSGIRAAVAALRRLEPQLVVGFGGFASLPGTAGAVLARIPLVLHEQNAYPGLVTRLLAPFARKVVVSQESATGRIRARRTEMVPYPIREGRIERSEARRLLGVPEEGTLTLVMGGSQGSLALNEGVIAALRELRDVRPLTLHSTGPAHLESVRARTGGLSNYFARPYVDAVEAWSAADLAITRAGIGTISEASFHGVPLIMVPLPTSAEDHQLHNARAFAGAGAGTVVEQKVLEDELARAWRVLLDDGERATASRAAQLRSPEGAARRFAELIERECDGENVVGAPMESR